MDNCDKSHEVRTSSNREDALIEQIPGLVEARDYGVDICMLASNLESSVKERIERHQIALENFLKLRDGKKL